MSIVASFVFLRGWCGRGVADAGRAGLAGSAVHGARVVQPLVTMHGTIMLLFWATAGGVHSRNDVLPLQIDATEMAFSAVERLVHCGPRRTRAAPGGHCRG